MHHCIGSTLDWGQVDDEDYFVVVVVDLLVITIIITDNASLGMEGSQADNHVVNAILLLFAPFLFSSSSASLSMISHLLKLKHRDFFI